MATTDIPEGFLGNLTADQQKKLEQLWTIVLSLSDAVTSSTTTADTNEPQPRRNSLARTNTAASKGSTATTPAYAAQISQHLQGLGMHASEIKQVQHLLAKISPEEIRDGLLSTARQDHPDGLFLRFLRARKWDVNKAFVMMLEAILWRMKEFHVDEEVIAKGELHALKASRDTSNAVAAKNGKEFLAQMRMGKAYVHGVDKLGRPIVVIRVRLHKPGAQSEETLNQFIIHVIESVRLLLVPPVETAVSHHFGIGWTELTSAGGCLRYDWVRSLEHGISSRQVHHQMLRSKLPRVTGCAAHSQRTMGVLKYVRSYCIKSID
jgi:hypothetical protein